MTLILKVIYLSWYKRKLWKAVLEEKKKKQLTFLSFVLVLVNSLFRPTFRHKRNSPAGVASLSLFELKTAQWKSESS